PPGTVPVLRATQGTRSRDRPCRPGDPFEINRRVLDVQALSHPGPRAYPHCPIPQTPASAAASEPADDRDGQMLLSHCLIVHLLIVRVLSEIPLKPVRIAVNCGQTVRVCRLELVHGTRFRKTTCGVPAVSLHH